MSRYVFDCKKCCATSFSRYGGLGARPQTEIVERASAAGKPAEGAIKKQHSSCRAQKSLGSLTLCMVSGKMGAQAACLCTFKGPSPLQRFRALCFSSARNLVDVCQVIRLSSDKPGSSEFDCRSSKLRCLLPRLIHKVDGTTFGSWYAVRTTNSRHLR